MSGAVCFKGTRLPVGHLLENLQGGVTVSEFVDVLVIEDETKKPYYLLENIRGVKAHHIYTRICDTNTPKPRAVQPDEIERIWRERFGVGATELERAKIYLGELDRYQEWTRGEIRTDNNFAGCYELRCHQTTPKRVHWVGIDDGKKVMIALDWSPDDSGRLYYYEADSIEFAVR